MTPETKSGSPADFHSSAQSWLERHAEALYAYLTTIGRRTSRRHRIEIWFAAEDGHIFLMSGGRERSDWVRNILTNPLVTVELGDETHEGHARIVQPGTDEDRRSRELLTNKYAIPGNPLSDWKRRSLPVVIEFLDAGAQPSR